MLKRVVPGPAGMDRLFIELRQLRVLRVRGLAAGLGEARPAP
jgi:hypothetical protein